MKPTPDKNDAADKASAKRTNARKAIAAGQLGRNRAQTRRRKLKKVLAAESYEDARQALDEAFEVMKREASPANGTPTPPVPAASVSALPSGNALPASPPGGVSAVADVKPASAPDVKPSAEASQPEVKPDATPEVKPEPPKATPEPTAQSTEEEITPKDVAELGVAVVDGIGSSMFGPHAKLDDEQRTRLTDAAEKCARKWLASSGAKAEPEHLLAIAMVSIYLPAALHNLDTYGTPLYPGPAKDRTVELRSVQRD